MEGVGHQAITGELKRITQVGLQEHIVECLLIGEDGGAVIAPVQGMVDEAVGARSEWPSDAQKLSRTPAHRERK